MTGHETELERIRTAYRERDRARAAGGPRRDEPVERPGLPVLHAAARMGLLDALAVPGGARRRRVLEVGCGSGYFLHRLASTVRRMSPAST